MTSERSKQSDNHSEMALHPKPRCMCNPFARLSSCCAAGASGANVGEIGFSNRVILRAAIIGELDAINLYEEMAGLTENEDIRTDKFIILERMEEDARPLRNRV